MDLSVSQVLLGLYLTLEDYSKVVKPGDRITFWSPPNFEMVSGMAGVSVGSNPIHIVKLKDGTCLQVTDDNVFLFQPR